MALSVEERKARRVAGMERAKKEMTPAERILRALTNGRPPVSELKSPTAAISAARAWHRELETRIKMEGLSLEAVKYGVAVAYISPDLSLYCFTSHFLEDPKAISRMLSEMDGKVAIGILFGISEPTDHARVLVGSRPFIGIKQFDEWLEHVSQHFSVSFWDKPQAYWESES